MQHLRALHLCYFRWNLLIQRVIKNGATQNILCWLINLQIPVTMHLACKWRVTLSRTDIFNSFYFTYFNFTLVYFTLRHVCYTSLHIGLNSSVSSLALQPNMRLGLQKQLLPVLENFPTFGRVPWTRGQPIASPESTQDGTTQSWLTGSQFP
jgi:hypothetical protein